MAIAKTHRERAIIITRIIELVRELGRITTKDIVSMFGLHQGTAQKYMHIAIKHGNLIRYGRYGVFCDLRAIIDFDHKRYVHRKDDT